MIKVISFYFLFLFYSNKNLINLILIISKKQVITALKRGVEFGILKRCKGHYLMNETDEILQNSCPKALLRPKPSRVSFSNPDRVQKRSIRFPKSAARRTKNTSKKPNRQNSDSFLWEFFFFLISNTHSVLCVSSMKFHVNLCQAFVFSNFIFVKIASSVLLESFYLDDEKY